MRSPELLPPTLENLLLARIDRLAAGPRRLAQTAAAIGRTFPIGVLTHVMDEDVAEELASLFRTEIVRELRRYPDFECEFTHGLLRRWRSRRSAATVRRELCERIAAAYEELYAVSLDDHAERLAHYHAQAGNLPQALEYAERARAGLAREPPVLRSPVVAGEAHDEVPDVRSDVDGEGPWKSGITGTSFAICTSALFRTRACSFWSRIRSAWSRSRVTSRWQ